jgi:hypothetical protein
MGHSTVLAKMSENATQFNDKTPINPITNDQKTFFRIIKLSCDLKNENFFNYELNNHSIFIRKNKIL